MTVRISQTFSPELPVNGGCPQGSLLSILIFHISTDEVELTPEQALNERNENDVHVGKFFDRVDRERLQSVLQINQDSELLPSIALPELDDSQTDHPEIHDPASPLRGSSMSDLSSSEYEYEYFQGVRSRPDRTLFSDSDNDPDYLRYQPDHTWSDRPITCIKYVDDCLSSEKKIFRWGW